MRFRKTDSEELSLNLAPLIDVVFLLLIFFMVTTSFTKENALDLSLPEGNFEPLTNDILSITISVDKLDNIRIGGDEGETQPTSVNTTRTLSNRIQNAVERAKQNQASLTNAAPTILIKADKSASHGRVIQLMDAISQLGISNIQFVAIPVQK